MVFNAKDEDNTNNARHLWPLHLVAVSQEDKPIMASYVPQGTILRYKKEKKKWYDVLCEEDLKDYMKLDATKLDNLKKICEMNDISYKDLDLGDRGEHVDNVYYQVLLAVAKKGAYKDFYTASMEGYHRVTGLVHAILRSTIDQTSGIVVPDSIKVKDFLAVQLKVDSSVNDAKLRSRMKNAFFQQASLPVMETFTTTMYFPKDTGYDVKETASHIIRASRAIAEQKKSSVTKCPFAQIGNLLAKYIGKISDEGMIFRADFSDTDYPTHPPQNSKQVTDAINAVYHDVDGHDMCKKAYDYCDLLDHKDYQHFLDNPLSDKNISEVTKLLQRDPLVDRVEINGGGDESDEEYLFHIEDDITDQLNTDIKQKKVSPPSKISFPFYPSFDSMSTDIGPDLEKKSKLNPYIANNMILGPMIYTILYAALKNAPVADILGDEKRRKEIHYWLRFHNNMSHKRNVLSTHMAYEIIYKIGSTANTPGTLMDDGAAILGCTHMIVNVFMAVLSCATESSLHKGTEADRKKALKDAADMIRDAFNRIGTTEAGREVSDVIKLLGDCIIMICIFFCIV